MLIAGSQGSQLLSTLHHLHQKQLPEKKSGTQAPTMASSLGRRVVHFPNLPMKLCMPTSFENITEIAFKTIPSASKIEIRRVLESMYGFEIDKVRTLNREGKKKKRGGILIAQPDYKKAYVTLKSPISMSPNLFPIRVIEEERRNMIKESKKKPNILEEGQVRSHWLDNKDAGLFKLEKEKEKEKVSVRRDGNRSGDGGAGSAKSPRSSMGSPR